MTDKRICAWHGCELEFTPATHNQKYHDEECCRLATNEQIMARYYKNKARRGGQFRPCHDCGLKLSRYNETDVCQACTSKRRRRGLGDILGDLGL
jgi:hypothetical protein